MTPTSPAFKTRIERDLLGDLTVPADAYYGVQTARALENFRISGVELQLYPNFIRALVSSSVKPRTCWHSSRSF